MTARAGCLGVLSCQRKQNQVVIKGGAVRVQSIMTGHAVCPKCEDVFLRKNRFHLKVTVGAGKLVEGRGVAFGVTIFAGEGGAV